MWWRQITNVLSPQRDAECASHVRMQLMKVPHQTDRRAPFIRTALPHAPYALIICVRDYTVIWYVGCGKHCDRHSESLGCERVSERARVVDKRGGYMNADGSTRLLAPACTHARACTHNILDHSRAECSFMFAFLVGARVCLSERLFCVHV